MDDRLLPEHLSGRRPKRVALLRGSPDLQRDHRVAGKLGRSLGEFYALPESDQEWLLAADELKLSKCPDCGRDREECKDVERTWYPQREVCYARAAEAAANRRYDEMHEAEPFHDGAFEKWAEKPSDETPFHFRDGVTIYVTAENLTPDDDFVVPRLSDRPI